MGIRLTVSVSTNDMKTREQFPHGGRDRRTQQDRIQDLWDGRETQTGRESAHMYWTRGLMPVEVIAGPTALSSILHASLPLVPNNAQPARQG